MTLLILVLQGLVFALLLFFRFFKGKKISDLFLGLILLVTGYRTTSFIIGFMSWYDTYPNTKINYFLIGTALFIGPLIYFYIRSICQPYFKFKRKHLWHFLLFFLLISLSSFVYIYDSFQPGFGDVQNGVLFTSWFMQSGPWLGIVSGVVEGLYYIFSVRLFIRYRRQILQFFSNTFKVELNWIRLFLILYIVLYIFGTIVFIFAGSFVDLSWTDMWWWHFANALVVVYVGVRGYFTSLDTLEEFESPPDPLAIAGDSILHSEDDALRNLLIAGMEDGKLYTNPDLTLRDLAREMGTSSNRLSALINNVIGKNFNDFVNEYRVEEVKVALKNPDNAHLSMLGIALDSGFNSKATFNRVFKKMTGQSPSEFVRGT